MSKECHHIRFCLLWPTWYFTIGGDCTPRTKCSNCRYRLSVRLTATCVSFTPIHILQANTFYFFRLFSRGHARRPSPRQMQDRENERSGPLAPILCSAQRKNRLCKTVFFQRKGGAASMQHVDGRGFNQQDRGPPPRSYRAHDAQDCFFKFRQGQAHTTFRGKQVQGQLFPFSDIQL